MSKFLIIQTAFIGDVVLATSVIESLATSFPDAEIHFLLRKGNEKLLEGHPKLKKLLIWNKKTKKYLNLFGLLKEIRSEKYDYVINLQRFASTGILTAFSKGKIKVGFRKNPLSFAFTIKVEHRIEKGIHEVDRNLGLIKSFANELVRVPKLYPSLKDKLVVEQFMNKPYVCLAPASVWFTKQLPEEQWVKLCRLLTDQFHICFLGAPGDANMCDRVINNSEIENFTNFCGKLTFLQSAALMQNAVMNYVNDSAPLHFSSAVNARLAAFFCSTIPEFGFGPLSDGARIAEVDFDLECRPCGLHGKKECPKGHFDCGHKIELTKYLP
jgi:ADP-heptose:LPS heptosyltransferase